MTKFPNDDWMREQGFNIWFLNHLLNYSCYH
jgi:hypothetical protein